MRNILVLYLAVAAYAVIRYVAFAPQNLANLPVFILNKGVSMAAALCFALAFWQQWRRQRGRIGGNEPATWFRAGVFGAFAHVPMSLAILRPAYFKEFFAGERLSFNGELVFLFGALTAGAIYLVTRTHWSPRDRWWLSTLAMALLFTHTLCMGIARGVHLNKTHAYLPPMWMLSLVGVAMGAAFLIMAYPAGSQRATMKEANQ
jgi:hypothetical protein